MANAPQKPLVDDGHDCAGTRTKMLQMEAIQSVPFGFLFFCIEPDGDRDGELHVFMPEEYGSNTGAFLPCGMPGPGDGTYEPFLGPPEKPQLLVPYVVEGIESAGVESRRPTSALIGTLFLNSEAGQMQVWTGTKWQQVWIL